MDSRPMQYLRRGLMAGGLLLASGAWAQTQPLPPMKLDAQFRGVFQDTVIQRWVDPQTGVMCYLYIPVKVPNQQQPDGLVIYGANTLGSLSCVPPPAQGRSEPRDDAPKTRR
ncbi:MAG: hypothetical protein LDL19_08645 [Thiobacillus sp.]|nr:hypothetical protein [Thiobacillus sp.]